MSDLIERLRQAKNPDRNLGREVLLACGWHKTCVGHYMGPQYHWSSPDRKISFDDDRFYDYDPTSSLDTAKALASEFYWIASEGKTRETEPLGGAQVFRKNYLVKPLAEAEHERVEIALCIAVLMARAISAADGAIK